MSKQSRVELEIDGVLMNLADFARNAGLPLETVRLRVQRRQPPYTSAVLLADARALDAKARGMQARDHAKRAAVVGLKTSGMSVRKIAKAVGVSPSRVQQILGSEGYSGKSSGTPSS